MTLKEQLNSALKDALRSGDSLRKNTLRMTLAAIKQAEVDNRKAVTEQDVLAMLQKQVKMREETIAEARKAGREDMIAEAEAEIAVLKEFLPEPLDDDALRALAQEVIAETGAASMRDMGKVMGALLPRVAGRASGGQVSAVVRELLNG